MADGADCEVSSNGEVFDDVDEDPHSILQNVAKTCIKIMIPSMAESSSSKLSSSCRDGSLEHDVKFGDDDSPHDGVEYDQKPFAGGTRAVKWTLESMAAAMDSVLAGELSTTNASRQYCIPRTTLLDRLAMKVRRQHVEQPGTYPLNPENTLKVIDFYHQHEDLNKPALLKGILRLAEELAVEQGTRFETPLHTRKWLKLFVQKYPDLRILQYNRTRVRSASSSGSRSSVTMAPILSSATKVHQPESSLIHLQISGDLAPYSQQISNVQNTGTHGGQSSCSDVISSHVPQGGPHHHQHHRTGFAAEEEDNQAPTFDTFESALAKQGLDAVERKLSSEQKSYFTYRFCNGNLEKGFELWKLCKIKAESSSNFDTFEKMLASQAVIGIEKSLSSEFLKYFKYRHENPGLEEGYKLWSVLKAKTVKKVLGSEVP